MSDSISSEIAERKKTVLTHLDSCLTLIHRSRWIWELLCYYQVINRNSIGAGTGDPLTMSLLEELHYLALQDINELLSFEVCLPMDPLPAPMQIERLAHLFLCLLGAKSFCSTCTEVTLYIIRLRITLLLLE